MRKLSLSQLAKELKTLVPKIEPQTEKIVLQSEDLKNAKRNEFKFGERPDGSNIGENKSKRYAIFKRQKNPLARGKVDLILTGSFTKGIFTKKKSKDTYIFESKDSKAKMLFDKYGQDLKGLNEITKEEIQNDSIAKELKEWIRKQLKLT